MPSERRGKWGQAPFSYQKISDEEVEHVDWNSATTSLQTGVYKDIVLKKRRGER